MTDEELRKEFKRLANLLTVMYLLLLLLVGVYGTLNLYSMRRLICSAENPPKACRE